MTFREGWRLLPIPETGSASHRAARPMPVYGWVGLAVIVVAEVLLYFRLEPVYTNATPILWYAYIALIDAWTYKRSSRSLFHPSRLRTPRGRSTLLIMLAGSVVWWVLFEFINCYLENWHYIGLPDNFSRYPRYALAFATIFPGILCTAEFLITFTLFQDRGIVKSYDTWSRLDVSVGVPLVDDGRQPIPLSRRFLIGSLIGGALAVAIPQLLPWREVRWYLFAPAWVGYIFLLEPVLHRYGAPSLFRAWELRRVRAISAYLVAGVICGLLWEFWNYWAGAKWFYTVPFTETIRYFEMPLLGFFGFVPFAWECYAFFGLSLLLCGQIRTDDGKATSGVGPAWALTGGILFLCAVTYLAQPKEFFPVGHVVLPMPREHVATESPWTEALEAIEAGEQSLDVLLVLPWHPDNHTDADLRHMGAWLRDTDPAKRRTANLLLRARSVASRFSWAHRGVSADDLSDESTPQ